VNDYVCIYELMFHFVFLQLIEFRYSLPILIPTYYTLYKLYPYSIVYKYRYLQQTENMPFHF